MMFFKIESEEFWQKIENNVKETGLEGGVYRLHCLKDPEGDEVIPIQRCMGEDNEGILYIGKANQFLNRVIDLKKSLLPNYKTKSHVCGLRYNNDAHANFRDAFPIERLCVTLVSDQNPKRMEEELLFKYCKKFGETPPLNSLEQANI